MKVRTSSSRVILAMAYGICALGLAPFVLAQETAAKKPSKSSKVRPDFKILYPLDSERFSAEHRRATWYNTHPGAEVRVLAKINVLAQKTNNRMMTESIRDLHVALRELGFEVEVLWQMLSDESHDNKHIKVKTDEQAKAMIAAHTNPKERRLHVYIVELDVDLDGDGTPEAAVGARLPSVDASVAESDGILLDDDAVEKDTTALAHAIGHFVGIVSLKGKAATDAFTQTGAQAGCKACLKSRNASPAP